MKKGGDRKTGEPAPLAVRHWQSTGSAPSIFDAKAREPFVRELRRSRAASRKGPGPRRAPLGQARHPVLPAIWEDIAQLGARQTEDLKVPCSIHGVLSHPERNAVIAF
jgi:hypothetical protein